MRVALNVDEAGRLKALDHYEIINSPPERGFDMITHLAASACGTPFASINFLGQDFVWSKSAIGLEVESGADWITICRETVCASGVFECEDLSEDIRFSHLPFVEGEPFLKFYAGVSIVNTQGFAVGTLSVYGQSPHQLSAQQKEMLQILAEQALELLEGRVVDRNRKNLLLQTTKLASLGEMAVEIAHEINNPLTAMIVGISSLRIKFEKGMSLDQKATSEFLRKLEFYGTRVTKISNQLKQQSRDDTSTPLEIVDLKHVLNEAKDLCAERFKSNQVRYRLDLLGESFNVRAKSTQIVQIMINLINNAIDASARMNEPIVRLELCKNDGFVEFRVSDCGMGVPVDIEKLVFQPFFSTKPFGKGTGLGLSISQTIAHEHGGKILIDRQRGGSCFCLQLPAV